MILNKSVMASHGEVSVKAYLCTKFNSSIFGIKADGYLEVTNKRILFQSIGSGATGKSVIHSEAAIADVSQIKVYKGNTFSLATFAVGLVLALALATLLMNVLTSLFNGTTIAGIISLAFAAYAIYRVYYASMKKTFSLIVNTKGGEGRVVSIAGLSPFGNGNSAASKGLAGEPAKDSDILINEIGALILDIQHMGEGAIQKWKSKDI